MNDDNPGGPSRGDGATCIAQQQINDVGQYVSFLGKVTIEIDRHAPILASQLLMSSQECSWRDDVGRIVLRHTFKDALKNYHPWRHAAQHPQWTMAFDHDEMQGCVAHCSIDGHNPHLKTVPIYVFSEECDYQSVQSLLRGVPFVCDYETISIKCKASDSQASKSLCVKSWRSRADALGKTLTIPITVSGKAGYRLKHIEVQARWMRWEKQDAKVVKLDFIQVAKKKSSADTSANAARRSTFRLSRTDISFKSSPSNDAFMLAPDQLASPEVAQKMHHFLLEFKDKQARDRFYDDHASLEISYRESQATSPSASPPVYAPSLWSLATSPSIATTSAPTPPDIQRSPKSKYVDEATLTRLPGPMAHDYMRVGGPNTMQNVVTTSFISPIARATFHRHLSNAHDEFRVLRIGQGRDGSPLSCDLEHCQIRTPPKYDAISYCWGTESPSREITSGNLKGFLISEHLWRALQRLRMANKERLVWIDALCIDQHNVVERNHQIALMRQIYTTAFRTIIWIGDLQGPARRNCSRAFADDDDTDLTLCVHPGLAETEHENAVEDLRRDLEQLQERNAGNGRADVWWRRLWTVQEFHFSTRSPSVYIGPHAVKWIHFCALFDTFPRFSNPIGPFLKLQKDVPSSLSELIIMTGPFHCSDPRDRVFALLGMAQHAGKVLAPDYRRSVIRVIEDACMYLIQESATLDVLLDERTTRSIWGREQLHGIVPTWIPDLTCLLGASVMLDDHKNNAGLVRDRPPQPPIVELLPCPTPLFSLDAQYDMPRTLKIRAVYFDTIVRRTRTADIPPHQRSPCGSLIYNSLKERGHIIDQILNKLEYDFAEHRGQNKHELDVNPGIGRLMLDYLLEGRRSYVEELERRARPPEKDLVTSYERQEEEDLAYLRHEAKHRGCDLSEDSNFVRERWALKISRAEANERFVPERLREALESGNTKIEQDFLVARDLGNLFAYARGTRNRFYLHTSNLDAPMRRDVLDCSSIAEVKRLKSQYDLQARDLELHDYNAKCRERDFFKTQAGFLGLGPACLEEGDEIVIPLGSSRPFILRRNVGLGSFHTLVGEAVVPSIMSGKWTRLEKDSWTDYRIM
ncbi:uncharacterized protein RCC_10012 [Ramularia collo-cygni]|uniref:Heterokaryon incompatibility domain-containing protein n=1 Tax=Ramularia collo-cygni TaxID=112498 RepID=A0A2D3VIY0_9PEZI|nr:uncharacterized protein RCC_10012 [Ramularia collo-cygni]CZT24291.1 uncharacterized protein RCC_10012 [Ramularia collo-cygni]